MKEILEQILKDLSLHHKRTRDAVIYACAEERVKQNLEVYMKEIEIATAYLATKDGLKMLRRINRQ